MAQKVYPINNNFSKGELSSRMEGRVDIQGYYQGCKIMENCIMVAQGGAEKRPGTIYLGEAYSSDYRVRLIPFEVNDDEIYVLEFGNQYIRIWDALTKTVVSNPEGKGVDIIQTEYNEADLSEIQFAQTEGKIFFAHSGYVVRQLVKNTDSFSWITLGFTTKRWETGIDVVRGDVVVNDGVYYIAQRAFNSTVAPVSGEWEVRGTVPKDLSTDITYWASGSYSVGTYSVYNEVLWKCIKTATSQVPGEPVPSESTVDVRVTKWFWGSDSFVVYFNRKYGVGDWNFKSRIVVPFVGQEVTITYKKPIVIQVYYWEDAGVSLPDIISPQTLYKETTVLSGAAKPYDQYDYVYDGTSFVLYRSIIDSNSSDLSDDKDWQILEGNPLFNEVGDYPAAITFMSDRLYLAGTRNRPQTIYASKIGDYNNFSIGTDDDDAFVFTMAADRSSRIKWMVAKDYLMFGTTSSEWLATGLTPTSIQILRQSAYGSAYQQASFVADTLLFFQKGGRKLREYVYSNDNKAYLANDLTFFADHITSGGIVESTYQQNPDSILWSAKEDGDLIGLTYDRMNQIAGWHRHITQGLFESIISIDGSGDEDELWMVVKRNVDGLSVRHIEHMSPREFESQDQGVFVDSAKSQSAGDLFSITSIAWSDLKITVTYAGVVDFANADYIKIIASGEDDIDIRSYKVDNLNVGAKAFDLLDTVIPGTRKLNYDGGTGEVPIKGEVITGGTSGANGIVAWVDTNSTGVSGSIMLHAVATGPFVNDEPVSGNIGAVAVANGADIPNYYNTDEFDDPETGTVMKVTDTFTGLSHLEGETVSILGDGAVFADQEVSGGEIVLSSRCNYIVAGLSYAMRLMPESIELPGSSTLGAKKRISAAKLKLYKSLGGKVGPDEKGLQTLDYRDTSIPFGAPPGLLTGNISVGIDTSPKEEATILIYHDQPLPMTVLAIITDITFTRG